MLETTEVEFNEYFKLLDEFDKECFPEYSDSEYIQQDIFEFSICGFTYQTRIIVDKFKVILDAASTEPKISSNFLNIDEVFEAECMTKLEAKDLAVLLATEDSHYNCTGDDLLMYGFRRRLESCY